MNKLLSLAIACVVTGVWGSSQAAPQSTDPHPEAESAYEVVAASDVKWGPLNPARGEASPKAGALWGDRTGSGASGFLVKFVDGFRSPPHIHNVSYRGVVIRGLIHNDDPAAGEMYMPAGSFWTQPAGGVHVTAAKGRHNLAYIEIEEGPYLVRPIEEAFDRGERPVNVDASNVVWIDAFGVPGSAEGPKVAYLWGRPKDDHLNGTLVKLPAGFAGEIRNHGSSFRAVVIQGRPEHRVPGETEVVSLEPGSYFGSTGASVHQVSCEEGEGCTIYVRMVGRFDVLTALTE